MTSTPTQWVTNFSWTPGYLGSSPDPGCEFPAFISPKNTEERNKIILSNVYEESNWWSLITNHDNSHLNKKTFFPYSSSFDPVSSSSNHLPKIKKFTPFLISDSTVLRKTDHFDISFAIWKLFRSRELTKPTLLDPDHFPGSLSYHQKYGLEWAIHGAKTGENEIVTDRYPV